MAEGLNRQRLLLRFSDGCEDAAAGLIRFRDNLPRSATRITAIIGELFAVSAFLKRIRNSEGNRHYADSFYRINDDLALLFRTLEITLADILNMFARSHERPDQMCWEDLNHRMDREERFELQERLEWYRDFLEAQFDILEGRSVESPPGLRADLQDLLSAQEAAQRRYRRTSVSGASTPRPRMPNRPPLHRLETPVSPTVLSDEWDNYTHVDRPPVLAPEPPLSPTFTSSSSQTMGSSQTSYSSDQYIPSPPEELIHWAQNVFDGSAPLTSYKPSIQSDDASKCYGTVEQAALHNLVRDGFQLALQLKFDNDRVCARLYWRPTDYRARILMITKDRYSRPLYYCTPLTNLKVIRDGSCMQLCRSRRDGGRYSLWARLNFLFHERMVLFYSTFVAMKHQDERGIDTDSLIDHLELLDEESDDCEQELFAGRMKHGTMLHALRLFRDRASGVVRLEASALRGPLKDVPIWTAFVTKYAYDADHVQYEGSGVISFAAIKPSPFVFISRYEPPTNRQRQYVLPFTSDNDARMFVEAWSGLCRAYGRHL